MTRTKLLTIGLVILLTTSINAGAVKPRQPTKQRDFLGNVYDYFARNWVKIGATLGICGGIYFLSRYYNRAAQLIAVGAAAPVARLNEQQLRDARAQHYANLQAQAPAGAPAPAPKAVAPKSAPSISQMSADALLLRAENNRGSCVEKFEEHAAQLLKGGLTEADETGLRETIIAILLIDATQVDGAIEAVVELDSFWELLSGQGTWLFEGLTSGQFAVAMNHLLKLKETNETLAFERAGWIASALRELQVGRRSVTSLFEKLKYAFEMRKALGLVQGDELQAALRKALIAIRLTVDTYDAEIDEMLRQLSPLG